MVGRIDWRGLLESVLAYITHKPSWLSIASDLLNGDYIYSLHLV